MPGAILLVEDEPAQALVVTSIMEIGMAQAKVTHCESLSSTLAQLERDRFDVILLDLGLSDAQGLEVVTRVHEAAPQTPIVVLTGQGDDGLGLLCIQAGAQDFLKKQDLSPELLANALRFAYSRRNDSVPIGLSRALFHLRSIPGEADTLKEFESEYLRRLKGARYLPTSELEDLAQRLAEAGASPRDLVSLHASCLELVCKDANERDQGRYLLNGAVFALAIMTYLADYYRAEAGALRERRS